jgi:hypothetical protein
MKAEAILITMPDGSTWQVPAKFVAEHRARHYEDEGDFAGEVDFALTDEYALLDWAGNNMNWEDVLAVAVKVRNAPQLEPADFQEAWVNGPKKVVDQALEPDVATVFDCRDCGEPVEVAKVRCGKCSSAADHRNFTF